jgi:hypothetical protein
MAMLPYHSVLNTPADAIREHSSVLTGTAIEADTDNQED